MEKQRSQSKSKSGRRLLVFLVSALLLSFQGYSQNISSSILNQLRVKPAEDQSLFTKTDLKFQVSIPNIKPSQIQVLSPSIPSDVTFRSIRKIEDYENGGTVIELWLNFEKKGTYQFSPLPLLIQNTKRTIRFEKVTISEDPSKQAPQIVIIFSNGQQITSRDELSTKPLFQNPTGKKLTFTVYLQYSNQLVQFNWDIPKDSIFTQTETFEFTEVRYREKNYSHDLIPVARFDWTALTTGPQPLPKIKITATDYSGYRKELILPSFTIDFTEGTVSSQNHEDKMFDASFVQQSVSTKIEDDNEISLEECETLARLYAIERKSILNYMEDHQNRLDYEASLGLPVTTAGDFSSVLIHIFSVFFVVFTVLLTVMIKRKNTILVLLFSVFLISSTVPLCYGIIKHEKKYGICKGCNLYSVPEAKAEAVSEIGAGNRVRITEETDKWIYIELGYAGGWVLKENVIIIK